MWQAWRRGETHTNILWLNLVGRDQPESLVKDCKIIMKRIFKELKEVHRLDLSGTGWRKVAGCELCRKWNTLFHDLLGNSWLAGKILATGEGLCSSELVSWGQIVQSLVSVRNSTWGWQNKVDRNISCVSAFAILGFCYLKYSSTKNYSYLQDEVFFYFCWPCISLYS